MKTSAMNALWRHPRFEYLEAKTVGEACGLIAAYGETLRVLAGGTDLVVAMRRGKITPRFVMNIKTIPALDAIRHQETIWRIGCLVTLDDLKSSSSIAEKLPILARTAARMATPQVRNVATLAGNLCNASPSADLAPPLIGLGAAAGIVGVKGERTIPLEDFFVGPGKTALRVDEMLAEVRVPEPAPNTRAIYLKLTPRSAIDLAVAGVAVVASMNSTNAVVSDIKIVLGAVAPTPMRAREAESILMDQRPDDELIGVASRIAAQEATPISDVRGSAGYRREMVRVLTARALKQALGAGEDIRVR